MNWTEPIRPSHNCPYNHVICGTPLGIALIMWKGREEDEDYGVKIGDYYIGEKRNLDDAKKFAKEWLVNKHKKLSAFLEL